MAPDGLLTTASFFDLKDSASSNPETVTVLCEALQPNTKCWTLVERRSRVEAFDTTFDKTLSWRVFLSPLQI